MPRYIDADKLYKKLYPLDLADKRKYTINAKAVADAIANIPTADVVEVVRCFQCRFGEVDDMSGRVMCNSRYAPWHRYKEEFTFSPNDFCRLGERKE